MDHEPACIELMTFDNGKFNENVDAIANIFKMHFNHLYNGILRFLL